MNADDARVSVYTSHTEKPQIFLFADTAMYVILVINHWGNTYVC